MPSISYATYEGRAFCPAFSFVCPAAHNYLGGRVLYRPDSGCAKTLGRHLVGVDIDPEYAGIASQKIQNVAATMYRGCYVSRFLGRIQSIRDIDAAKMFPLQLTSVEKNRLWQNNIGRKPHKKRTILLFKPDCGKSLTSTLPMTQMDNDCQQDFELAAGSMSRLSAHADNCHTLPTFALHGAEGMQKLCTYNDVVQGRA